MIDHAKHIGRVGALAVALGVGMAVATTPGAAWATPDTDNVDSASAPDSTNAADTDTTTDAGSSSTASDPTESPSTTPTTRITTTTESTTETTQTNPVAPNVVIRSSGGALTSDSYSAAPSTELQTLPADTLPAAGPMPSPIDTPKPESNPVSAGPPAQSSSNESEIIAAQYSSPFLATSKVGEAKLDTTSTAAQLDAMQRHAPARGFVIDPDQSGAQPHSTQMTAFSAVVQPPAPTAADPIAAFLAVPATFIATAAKIATAVLASFLTPAPGGPPESPLLWTVLAIVRRQLFNETPSIVPMASAPDALGNITISLSETDADGDRLVYSAIDGSKGTVTLNADGHSFTYKPYAGETGSDTVAITATDATNDHIHGLPGLVNALTFGLLGVSGHTAATTNVTVKLNTPPTLSASPGAPNPADGKVTVTVVSVDEDGDPLALSVTQPSEGSVSAPTLVDAASGTYTVVYTPTDPARHTASADTATATDKSDSFTVSVSDGHGASLTRTVDVTIAPDNDVPAFSTVTATADLAGKVTGTVVFTDGDNDPLIYTGSGRTAKGNVVVDAAGTFTYTPDRTEQFIATATEGADTDSVTITVNDGHGATVTLTVPVTVTPAAIASDGAAALAGAQSVIGSALGARAMAQAEMATLVTSLGATATGADLHALMAMIMADIAITQGAGSITAGNAAIRTKLGQGVTDADIAAIAEKVAAIRAAEASLPTPIAVAANARAVAVATTAATGAPVFSRVKDLVVSPDGGVTGTVVYIDPEGDPLLYNVLGVAGSPAPGSIAMNPLTGAFVYAPNPLFGEPVTSVTFGVFVNDGVHLVSQNITIGVTPTAEPATLAEAETALADIQADLEAAINDKIDALTTDPTAITAATAQIEAFMAAALAAKNQIWAAAQSMRV